MSIFYGKVILNITLIILIYIMKSSYYMLKCVESIFASVGSNPKLL